VSIIYEALRKTQRNREVRNMPARERVAVRNWDWLDKALVVFILVLLVFIVFLYWQHMVKRPSPQQVASVAAPVQVTMPTSTVVSAAPVVPADLILNGVLLSDNEKLALINKKSFHIGDSVVGMKIISIEIDSVQLDNNGQIVTLRKGS